MLVFGVAGYKFNVQTIPRFSLKSGVVASASLRVVLGGTVANGLTAEDRSHGTSRVAY